MRASTDEPVAKRVKVQGPPPDANDRPRWGDDDHWMIVTRSLDGSEYLCKPHLTADKNLFVWVPSNDIPAAHINRWNNPAYVAVPTSDGRELLIMDPVPNSDNVLPLVATVTSGMCDIKHHRVISPIPSMCNPEFMGDSTCCICLEDIECPLIVKSSTLVHSLLANKPILYTITRVLRERSLVIHAADILKMIDIPVPKGFENKHNHRLPLTMIERDSHVLFKGLKDPFMYTVTCSKSNFQLQSRHENVLKSTDSGTRQITTIKRTRPYAVHRHSAMMHAKCMHLHQCSETQKAAVDRKLCQVCMDSECNPVMTIKEFTMLLDMDIRREDLAAICSAYIYGAHL